MGAGEGECEGEEAALGAAWVCSRSDLGVFMRTMIDDACWVGEEVRGAPVRSECCVCERALAMLIPAANQLAAKMGLPPIPGC